MRKMAENKHANTRVWLPTECEVEIEPDTETELTTSDRFFGAHACISAARFVPRTGLPHAAPVSVRRAVR